MTSETDQYLIDRTLEGDTNAFGRLVDKYQNFVFTIAIKLLKVTEEAEEVAQDSFIKAYDSLSNFRGESKFSTWLYRIVYHKSLDRMKSNKRFQTYELNEEFTEVNVELVENGLDFMLKQERSEIIKKCIAELPEEDSVIMSLYYFEELPVKEIAKITDLSDDNIKIKLYRSRKKLFSMLENYFKSEISNRNGRAI